MGIAKWRFSNAINVIASLLYGWLFLSGNAGVIGAQIIWAVKSVWIRHISFSHMSYLHITKFCFLFQKIYMFLIIISNVIYCKSFPFRPGRAYFAIHDDVIKWKYFPRYWRFVRGIHRSPVNSLHKGQWRGALMFSLICVWINSWVNNGEAGDLRNWETLRQVYSTHLRRHLTYCDVIVIIPARAAI